MLNPINANINNSVSEVITISADTTAAGADDLGNTKSPGNMVWYSLTYARRRKKQVILL